MVYLTFRPHVFNEVPPIAFEKSPNSTRESMAMRHIAKQLQRDTHFSIYWLKMKHFRLVQQTRIFCFIFSQLESIYFFFRFSYEKAERIYIKDFSYGKIKNRYCNSTISIRRKREAKTFRQKILRSLKGIWRYLKIHLSCTEQIQQDSRNLVNLFYTIGS